LEAADSLSIECFLGGGPLPTDPVVAGVGKYFGVLACAFWALESIRGWFTVEGASWSLAISSVDVVGLSFWWRSGLCRCVSDEMDGIGREFKANWEVIVSFWTAREVIITFGSSETVQMWSRSGIDGELRRSQVRWLLRLCLVIDATHCDEHDDDVVLVFLLSLESKFEESPKGTCTGGFERFTTRQITLPRDVDPAVIDT